MSGHNNATFCCYTYVSPHKYTITQIYKYAYTTLHKYTKNTQIQNYEKEERGLYLDITRQKLPICKFNTKMFST